MLALTFLVGCIHLPSQGVPNHVVPPESALIGWRLVPGQELNYQHTVRLLRGDSEVARTESWVYLVEEVSPSGEALLQGRLTGLGTLVREDRSLLSGASRARVEERERERLEKTSVWIRMSTDGHVSSVSGLSWEDALPHRALGLVFPKDPVRVGMTWPNPESLAPYRNLVPSNAESVPSGQTQLVSFYAKNGSVFADLEFEGQIQTGSDDLPQIETQGEAQWDLMTGQLYEQSQRVSLSQYSEAFGGLLMIETRRQPQ